MKGEASMATIVTPELLALVPDDELYAEWLKRHPNQVLTAFSGVSDDQLRAECERRGVYADDDAKCTLYEEALKQRDEWKSRAEAAGRDHNTIVKRYADELADANRRAELAEERWRLIRETAIAAGLPEGVDAKSWLVSKLGMVTRLPKSSIQAMRGEDGKRGIQTLTLPSGRSVSEIVDVATLADLMCDDAGTT